MKSIYKFSFYAITLLFNFSLFAQGPGSGGEGPGGPEGNDPQPAPIDSTLIILAIIGIVYVLNFYRSKKTL